MICVGNLTLGGAGKTPTAIAIAQMLRDGRRARRSSSRAAMAAALAGPCGSMPHADRAARGRRRAAAARARRADHRRARPRRRRQRWRRRRARSVIVMDDGFQNPSLAKDLQLAVVDGRRGIGNGSVFPAGPLRAPLDAQLRTRRCAAGRRRRQRRRAMWLPQRARGLPVFHGRLAPDRDSAGAHRAAGAGLRRHRRSGQILRDARKQAGIDDRARGAPFPTIIASLPRTPRNC